jgi:hypothetical protein
MNHIGRHTFIEKIEIVISFQAFMFRGSDDLNHAMSSYYCQVMEKLVEIVHCLHVEIQDAFGPCGIA